jgi:hypothetical protein
MTDDTDERRDDSNSQTSPGAHRTAANADFETDQQRAIEVLTGDDVEAFWVQVAARESTGGSGAFVTEHASGYDSDALTGQQGANASIDLLAAHLLAVADSAGLSLEQTAAHAARHAEDRQ